MSEINKQNPVAYVAYDKHGKIIQNSLKISDSIPKDKRNRMYRYVPIVIDPQDFVPLPSVTICGKTWTTQNLDVTTYRNGDIIPQITDPTEWANATTGAWCYPNNDPALGAIYGKLYNHYAVTDPRNIAPQGWHVPVREEWVRFVTCTGGTISYSGSPSNGSVYVNHGYAITGEKLKEVGTTHWASPNIATNSTGFTGFGPGFRYEDGAFDGGSNYSGTIVNGSSYPDLPPYQAAGFWAKERYETAPGFRVPVGVITTLFHAHDIFEVGPAVENHGHSIRLVQDIY